jgi:DNA-binding cell septation regulator SpoVG
MKHTIDVSVLGRNKSDKHDRYRLKVSVHDIGIHIMGVIVQDSIIEGEKYYVTTPAHKVGAKFYKDITFETSKDLWLQIQNECIKAVEAYIGKPTPPPEDPLERLWK